MQEENVSGNGASEENKTVVPEEVPQEQQVDVEVKEEPTMSDVEIVSKEVDDASIDISPCVPESSDEDEVDPESYVYNKMIELRNRCDKQAAHLGTLKGKYEAIISKRDHQIMDLQKMGKDLMRKVNILESEISANRTARVISEEKCKLFLDDNIVLKKKVAELTPPPAPVAIEDPTQGELVEDDSDAESGQV